MAISVTQLLYVAGCPCALLWAILKCFGYDDPPEKLNGDGVHNLKIS
jgi:hypothetical protein